MVKVIGLASKKENIIAPSPEELKLTVMDFLLKRGYPIASSCSGEGICKKCVVNEVLVSCQIKLEDFLEQNSEIKISYL